MVFDEFLIWLVDVLASQVYGKMGTFGVYIGNAGLQSEAMDVVGGRGGCSKDELVAVLPGG